MQTKPLYHYALLTLFAVSLLWCIKSFEILFAVNLARLGLLAGNWTDAWSIITAPLVHGSLEHLFNNTLPLLILGTVLLYGYPCSRWRVLTLVWLGSGLGVLLFARPANHLGASGISHGIFFFLLVVSLFRRDKLSVGIMMLAFFMYGGMTMTIFPREQGVSYEYHFFGAVFGILAACLWYKRDPKPIEKPYSWEGEAEADDPVIGDLWREKNQTTQAPEP